MKHEIITFYPLQVWYVKHKHDMDPRPGNRATLGLLRTYFYYCRTGTLCGTSVLLTDQKRTPQILRAKTLRVLRQS